MKAVLSAVALALAIAAPIAIPTPVLAGPIETACNRSDRRAATRSACRCVDRVARNTLTRSEQRRAARFFANPDEAQRVRMSRSDRDNEFWARYRAFGAAAERSCAAS